MKSTRYHHGNLDAALLDEAVAQVRRRGAEKVSLRALAGTVGVSPSAAYGHFGDKDALLREVGQRGFTMLSDRMRTGMAEVSGDDDAAAVLRMRAVGTAYIGFAVEEPHLFRLMFGPLCRKTGTGDAGDTAYGILEQQLEELGARGLLRIRADEALQLLIWSVVHGFSSLLIEGQIDPSATPALLDTLSRLVLLPPASSPHAH